MSDIRVPVDIEGMAIAYLGPLFTDWTVGTARPFTADWQSDATRILRVSASGPGIRSWIIDDSTLTCEVWAVAETEAERASARLAGYLNAWPAADERVLDVSAGRPVNYPDPLTTFPRYLVTARISARAELLT